MCWHIKLGAETIGPLTGAEIRDLALKGSVRPETRVSTNQVNWSDAASIPGLTFGPPSAPPLPDPWKNEPSPAPNRFERAQNRWVAVGKSQARAIVNDLRRMDFREEVIPLDTSSLKLLTKDFGFWFVLFLGIVPLLIGT